MRRPNSPYLKVDICGRLVLNAYRTGDARQPGVDPVIQRIREDGHFDVARGVFIRIGKVGIYAARHNAGPGFRRRERVA